MLSWGELTSGSGQNPCSQSEEILKGERVQHICSREGVTVFVLENGKVYTRARGWKRKSKPGNFHHFKEQKIHFADSGSSHILFLSKAGNIYCSQVNSRQLETQAKEFPILKPQLLKGLSDRNIIQVACGNNHSLALTKDSQIFAWGQNTYGQLGVGMDNVSQHSPQSVISLTGMPVAQIAAGGDHSFTLSLSGTVFGWGRNNHGQLGLKDKEGRQKPSHVKLLDCKKVVHIACGEEHTAVLTKDGLVFTFGAGSYGQLGHNSTEDETKPHLVGYLFGKKASQIACGSYHTLVFIPSSGKIYSFGCGEKGQLGNRDTKDQLVPLPINIMDMVNKNGNGHTTESVVRRIFAGGDQSFAACSRAVDLVSSTDQSALNTLRRISTVDKLLERELNKITRKAIIRAFSSPQALCGSFLDVSKDGHFKTNGVTSGLDLSAIYLSFLNLAKKSLTLQVKNAVQNNLIPSFPRSPTCVETLRVYIIIPELIAVLGESEDSATLLESLNRSILSLEDSCFKILERWWCTMPYYFFLRLVRMYQKESHRLLQLTMTGASQCNPQLHNSLKILQTLYQVNLSRDSKISERNCYIPVMKMFKDALTAQAERWFPTNSQIIINELMRGLNVPEVQVQCYFSGLCCVLQQLVPYPCIFDLETKLELLNLESKIHKQNILKPILRLCVSRMSIFQDGLQELRRIQSSAYYGVVEVRFKGEPCYGPGVSQEFFTLFTQELYNNKRIFKLKKSSELLWFPNREPEMDDAFYLVGILCGLAVSNGFICNFHFPLALYKKLLSVPPTLEDLKELSPTLGTSLQDVLDYEYDDIEEVLCHDFTVNKKTADGKIIQQELIPDGSKIPVQKHNRKQYVDAVVDYKLNTSVKKQFEAFSQGFRSCYSLPIVDTFLPEELRDVIQGSTRYEWELLEQNAKYCEYQNTDRAVRNFWQVFESLPEEKKKRFLAFLSGTDRIPAGGIQNYCIKILKSRTDEPDSSYPRAYTCTMSLELPNYSSIEILREKLLHAIEFSEEFNAQPP
ncbi:probable E3 ubiquitin-protein ligase HERC4 isoform X2 [Chiloscyllium plagiosum]|uniref:probable E3 ubiquitin-protein ligase HERC4 isoform X2 n=1 Tax=Chiloscyllium plagiosum TaxID=36176 RepID=UPI001CB80A93|nr:probable E3 ubiquitin-protein ligase HERC4 isoform X2 [Chiloscyllium plagiosum]